MHKIKDLNKALSHEKAGSKRIENDYRDYLAELLRNLENTKSKLASYERKLDIMEKKVVAQRKINWDQAKQISELSDKTSTQKNQILE